jgi:hypothetical protein
LTETCIQKYVLLVRRFRVSGVEWRGVEEQRVNAVASADLDDLVVIELDQLKAVICHTANLVRTIEGRFAASVVRGVDG